MWLPLPVQFLLLTVAGWVRQQELDVIAYLRTEIAVLREQLEGRRLPLTDAQRRRLARAGAPLGRRRLAAVTSLVTPDTILRWYRELVARKYDGSGRSARGGKVATDVRVADLVVRMATENPTWGYTRIRDSLHHLGHDLGRTTVQRILTARGLEPAPERRTTTRWRDFLAAHAAGLCAADFFSVEVMTWAGLVRYQVLFVLHVASRRVHLAGVVRSDAVDARWMRQVARNLTDPVSGFLAGMSHLLLDRDPLFSKGLCELLESSGCRPVRLPRASPNLNAHAERWIRSCRAEALDRLVLLGEGHLRRVLREFVDHYNAERPHQGLDGALIDPAAQASIRSGKIRCTSRLGGLLRFYCRAAA